jgi:inosine/xanthosine triphosphate pyrophosphatase family protein
LPLGSGRTFGEMEPAEKQHFSHRALAFRKLREFLA